MNESVSLGRFAIRALIAAAAALGLLFAAGHLDAGGVALMAVAEALVIAGLLRISRRPLDVPELDNGPSERTPSGN